MRWRDALKVAVPLIVSLASAESLKAQPILTDQVQLLDPGLSIAVVQELGPGADCVTSPAGFGASFYCEDYSEIAPGQLVAGYGVDALGGFYQVETQPDLTIARFDMERWVDGQIEVLAQIPLCVPTVGPQGQMVYQVTQPYRLAVDPFEGHIYLALRSLLRTQSCYSGTIADEAGIVRISGLPTVLDLIPAGPQGAEGPQGPAGPQGPPGPVLTLICPENPVPVPESYYP